MPYNIFYEKWFLVLYGVGTTDIPLQQKRVLPRALFCFVGYYRYMSKYESPLQSNVRQGGDERFVEQEEYIDLQKKLQEDFEDFMKKVPPIEGDFSGDPKEILKLPTSQRKEALVDFKDTLARQRRAFAQCRQYIEKIINSGSGVALKRLSGVVEQFADTYAFSDIQRKVFEDVIAMYHKGRVFAFTMRKQFLNDVDLVNELTGEQFDSDAQFGVSVGLFGLEIWMGAEYFEVLDEYSIGFVHTYTHNGEIFYSIIINSDVDAEEKARTIRHEQEHIKHSYFMTAFEHCLAEKDFEHRFGCFWDLAYIVARYRKDASLDKLRSALVDLQRYVLMEVKDEFFAMMCSESLQLIREDGVSWFSRDGGIYDFLSEDIFYFQDECKDDKDFLSLVDEVLVQDYQSILIRAIQSFFVLFDILAEKHQHVRELQVSSEAITLLTDVPMQDWVKTVDRLLEQENKDL